MFAFALQVQALREEQRRKHSCLLQGPPLGPSASAKLYSHTYIYRDGTSSPCQGHVRYVQAPSLCWLSQAERRLTPSGWGATAGADNCRNGYRRLL